MGDLRPPSGLEVKPLPPDGLEGFTKWKENGPPGRTYWHKRIDGWEYFVFRGDEGATAAPLVIHDRGSAMGDGVTNFGYYPSMNQQAPNTFVTNDEALGRIAMGGDPDVDVDDTSEGSEEPGGLLDGWFSTNYVVKSPITISIAFAIVLILGYFAGRRNRAD